MTDPVPIVVKARMLGTALIATIPKVFRDALSLKPGHLLRVRQVTTRTGREVLVLSPTRTEKPMKQRARKEKPEKAEKTKVRTAPADAVGPRKRTWMMPVRRAHTPGVPATKKKKPGRKMPYPQRAV